MVRSWESIILPPQKSSVFKRTTSPGASVIRGLAARGNLTYMGTLMGGGAPGLLAVFSLNPFMKP